MLQYNLLCCIYFIDELKEEQHIRRLIEQRIPKIDNSSKSPSKLSNGKQSVMESNMRTSYTHQSGNQNEKLKGFQYHLEVFDYSLIIAYVIIISLIVMGLVTMVTVTHIILY